MYFDRLEKNLIDIIKEEQAKLGFRKEAIRLYYPLSSLNHFFEAKDSEAEMLTRLSGFPASLTKKLGNVTVTAKKDRFCFHIPEDGSVYVHEHTDANEFIRSLVKLLQHHGCTMNDIFSLFKDTSENVIFEEMNHGEVDWCILPAAQRTRITTALKMKAVISSITGFCRKTMRILNFKWGACERTSLNVVT